MPLPALRATRRSLRRALLPLASCAPLLALPTPAEAKRHPEIDGRERAVIARINDVRANAGLPALRLDAPLSRSADRHSRRMVRARTLSHTVWGEAALADRLSWTAGGARTGETIFWGYGSVRSSEIVRAWMRSPGHRDLLMSAGFARAGIGIRAGGGGVYATVDLAAR